MCIDIIPIFSLFSFDVVNSVCLVVILSSVVKYILNRKLDLKNMENCENNNSEVFFEVFLTYTQIC